MPERDPSSALILVLLLPGLVYLRGTCPVGQAMTETPL
jgi:hypothetical protein